MAARKTTKTAKKTVTKTTSGKTSRKTASKTKTTTKKTARKKKAVSKKAAPKTTARKPTTRWSQHVTETSDAMDLKNGVFAQRDPKKIALSLKHSAEASSRRKTGAYRSALSMLTFYINRAGKTLPKAQHARLEKAKDELGKAFHRD